jgi:hypothetical protein
MCAKKNLNYYNFFWSLLLLCTSAYAIQDKSARITAYTQNIHNAIVKWNKGNYRTYCIGKSPGSDDLIAKSAIPSKKSNTGGHSYLLLKHEAEKSGVVFKISDAFYITLNPGLKNQWVSSALYFRPGKLGDSSNTLSIEVEQRYGLKNKPPFTAKQAQKLLDFCELVNPIIKRIYGAPARNHMVSLVNGGQESERNFFYKNTNEIITSCAINSYGDLAQPRLLVHELVHAYRDNVVLTSDAFWQNNAVLSGFEEGMAEATALLVMEEFIGLYPNFFKAPKFKTYWNHARGMSHAWEYDFQNHEQLRNIQFYSAGGKIGSGKLRYAMSATVFKKMYLEDAGIFKKFNNLYYKILNSNHSITPTRELLIEIFKKACTKVENTAIATWINEQKILDCETTFGKKVFNMSHAYANTFSFGSSNMIYLLETHKNGSEWQWYTKDSEGKIETDTGLLNYSWKHQFNNVPGIVTLTSTWDNKTQRKAAIGTTEFDDKKHPVTKLKGPNQGPNPFTYKGLFALNEAQNDCAILPNCGAHPLAIGHQNLMLLHTKKSNKNGLDSGLYRLNIKFNEKEEPIEGTYYKLLGKRFINPIGVMGGIYSENISRINGMLFIEHENFDKEPPISIRNNSFMATRNWASRLEQHNLRNNDGEKRYHTAPGKTHCIYVNSAKTVLKIDFRTVGYGDGTRGNQMFLFNLDTFEDIRFKTNHLSASTDDELEFSVSNNFPTVLNKDSRITYEWINPKQKIISRKASFTIAKATIDDAGTYLLNIRAFGCLIQKKVRLSFEDNLSRAYTINQ